MCNINYHMVWSVKYRRKILTPEVEKYLQELVQQIADDKGFTVHLFECGEGVSCSLFCISSTKAVNNSHYQVSEGDHRQEIIRTFSGNKKPVVEGRTVEPFLLCGNDRICI